MPTFEIEDSFRQACGGRIAKLDSKGFVTFMGLIDDHVASQGATEFHAKGASENQSSCILFGALTFVTLYLGAAILYGKLHRK